MTKITADKVLKRETASLDRLRPITISLHPRYLEIGLKGTRQTWTLPWDVLLDRARFHDARQKLAEKQKRRAS